MSSGVVHTRITLGILGATAVSTLFFSTSPDLAIGTAVGILVNPDLDVDAGSISDYFIRRLGPVGRVLEVVWDIFWWPYRKSLKHGSPLSHWPGISTAGRVGYMIFMLIILPYTLAAIFVPGAWNTWYEWRWWAIWLWHHIQGVVGMTFVDTAHWIMDISTTEHKEK